MQQPHPHRRGLVPSLLGLSSLLLLATACGGKVDAEENEAPQISSGGADAGVGGSGATGGIGGSGGVGGTGGAGGAAGSAGQGGMGGSSSSTVTSIDLPSATTNGLTQFATVNFEVPPGTVSFSLTATSSVAGGGVFLTLLSGPNGTLYERTDAGPSGPFQPDNDAGQPGLPYGLLYPNAPDIPLVPGSYSAAFGAYTGNGVPTAATIDSTLILKQAPSPPQLGTAAVDIWFAQNSFGLNAQSAAQLPSMQEAVSALKKVFAKAGITLTDVAYRDVVGAPQLGTIDDQQELSQLLSIPDQEKAGRLSVFMVEQIDLSMQGGVVLGVAAGAPGPAVVAGKPHAGVAVSLLAMQFGGTQLGETTAHELGHYLGLEHTTDADADGHDPIGDTPECTNTQFGYALPELCTSKDAFNFMFWTNFQSPTLQDQVSPGQRTVLNLNPSIANPGGP